MDITSGFLELLSGEIMGLPGGWVNMASETQNDCHNYKLEGTSSCGSIPSKNLFIQLPAFEPVTYATVEEGFENANKEKVTSWVSKSPVVKFTIGADATVHNTLEIIGMLAVHGSVTFINLVDDVTANVKSVKVAPSLDDAITRLEVTIEIADAAIESSICCGSYYEDAPFTECNGEGETGDPSDDPNCVGFIVTIGVTTGPDLLTATPSGGSPSGPITYNWYLDDEFLGTGPTITPVLPGVYRVDVQQGNCYATNETTWSTPCEEFMLDIQQIDLGDGSVALIALPNLIITALQWQELIAAVWTDIIGETAIMFQPDHSGSYRVTGSTAGECTDESDQVDVVIEGTECDGLFTITLENVDGVPTVTINDYAGVGTPTYSWYYDPGDGSGPAPGPWTGPTVPDAEPGLYIVGVTLEDCVQSAQVLLGCEATTPSGDCNGNPCCDVEWFQEFIGTGTETTLHVTNFTLPDPGLLSENQIMSKLLAFRDTNEASYRVAPDGASQYSIDYAGQNILLSADFPLEAGQVFSLRKIRL